MKSHNLSAMLAAALAALSFVSCDNTTTEPPTEAAALKKDSVVNAEQGLSVAFIYGDSVNANYRFLIDAEAELERESKLIDERIRRKYERAEKRAGELQREAPTMGQLEMQEAQIELQNLEVEIREFQDKLARDFRKREVELQQNYMERVNKFLDEYNSDGKYDMIMNFQPGGNLLWMSDAFDITDEVLRGLNEAYDREMDETEAVGKKK